jgi:predicted AlkP superfamily phosphohydrolase/phosphomutase
MAPSMNSLKTPRQLIIGLDGMEWELVRKWTAAGKLPNFRRLMDEGAQAQLSTVADRFPDSAWNCLCSGLNPAYLGRYFYVQHDPETGGMRHMPDDSFGVDYLWDHLSDAGHRVGVLEVPHIGPSQRLNGFQICWGTHAAQGPRFSVPASLLREVNQRFGRHPVGECDSVNSERARKTLRHQLLDGVRAHGELFRHCIAEREWEVLIAVFAAPHCAGHQFWHDMDLSHRPHDPNDRDELATAIEEIYCAVDREVGQMIEAAGPGARVFVVSAHGMGPLRHASWNLPEMLDHWGYGRESSHNGRVEKPRRGSINAWRILRMVVPGRLQYATYAALPQRLQNELVFRYYRGNRSWEQCRAFAVPNNDTVGAIRINLKGRDHNGIVDAGLEYEQICDDICAALLELKDPVSGKPVVERISRIQQELRGPYLDRLPDITVQWDASFPWSSVQSPRFGTIELRDQDTRSGSHTSHGFLLAMGEGIAPGTIISGASIYDFVPTIMNTAGLHAPAGCEGRPLFCNQRATGSGSV